jgi:hypothetical protein
MTPGEQFKAIEASVAAELANGRRMFEALASGTEVILGGQALVEVLKRRNNGESASQDVTDLRRLEYAFAAARTRHRSARTRVGDIGVDAASAFDSRLMLEFEQARARRDAGPGRSDGRIAFRSASGLLAQAETAQRAVADAIAQAPGSGGGDDEILPPPGSGEDGGSSGGESGETVPPPSSFEEYPPDKQIEAQQTYDQEVEPSATEEADSARRRLQEALDQAASEGLDGLKGAAGNAIQNFNNSVTALVAGVAFAAGGLLGAALGALALILIPVMLAAFEDFVTDKLTQLAQTLGL